METNMNVSNTKKLVKDNVNFLVRADEYDVTRDSRLLIPFVRYQKIGFVNRNSEVVVEAQYNIYHGDAKRDTDCINVGVLVPCVIKYEDGSLHSYDNRYKWGIIDANGKELLKPEYKGIVISMDNDLFTINSSFVVDRQGKTVVQKGKYVWVDGFDHGYARVKKEVEIDGKKVQRWGIINTCGEEVLAPEYTNIWKFYGKGRTTTRVEGNHSTFEFNLLGEEKQVSLDDFGYENGFEEYGTHYGEYAGSFAQDVMGYSDDVIDDAFDGDPEAYWNID